jgi:transcriptional regulator with XRE-family HTH domain
MLIDNMRWLRLRKGLTQAALAEQLGLSRRNIENWEQGHREPDLRTLRLLANTLGVTLDELTADPPEPEPVGAGKRKRK